MSNVTVREMHVVTGILMTYTPDAGLLVYDVGDGERAAVYGPPPAAMRPEDVAELVRLGWVHDPSLPAWRKDA